MIQSNFNGTAILKKKSYSTGLLIVLIILFFPAAIIYYIAVSDNIVTITNLYYEEPTSNTNTETFDSYCEDCGQGLFKNSKFYPGGGKDLNATGKDSVEETPENVIEEKVEEIEVLKCSNCGTELSEENNFCPNCGKRQ